MTFPTIYVSSNIVKKGYAWNDLLYLPEYTILKVSNCSDGSFDDVRLITKTDGQHLYIFWTDKGGVIGLANKEKMIQYSYHICDERITIAFESSSKPKE